MTLPREGWYNWTWYWQGGVRACTIHWTLKIKWKKKLKYNTSRWSRAWFLTIFTQSPKIFLGGLPLRDTVHQINHCQSWEGASENLIWPPVWITIKSKHDFKKNVTWKLSPNIFGECPLRDIDISIVRGGEYREWKPRMNQWLKSLKCYKSREVWDNKKTTFRYLLKMYDLLIMAADQSLFGNDYECIRKAEQVQWLSNLFIVKNSVAIVAKQNVALLCL